MTTQQDTQHNHIHGLITMAHLKGLYTRFPERFEGNTPDVDGGVKYHLEGLDKAGVSFARQNTALQFVNEINESQKVWESLYKRQFDAMAIDILSGKTFGQVVRGHG